MTRLSVRAVAGSIVSLIVSAIYVLGSILGSWASHQTFGKAEHPEDHVGNGPYYVGLFAIAGIIAATVALMKKRAGVWACAILHIGFALFWVGRIAIGASGPFAVVPIAMSTFPGGLCLWAVLKKDV